MNPSTWTGGQFLAFCLPAAAAACLIASWSRLRAPPRGSWPRGRIDPYAIALLAHGHAVAIRMAVVLLVHRGLLAVRQDAIRPTRPDAESMTSFAMERAVMASARYPLNPRQCQDVPSLKRQCQDLEAQLRRDGLLVDAAWAARHRRVAMGALAMLVAMAGATLAHAAIHDRAQAPIVVPIMVGIALAMVVLLATCFASPWPSVAGRTLLRDLRRLLAPTRKQPITDATDPAQILLLCAVYGIGTMRGRIGDARDRVFPRDDSSSSSSGSGSSCGSSCGSSSCGGGGCGGCGGGGD